MKTRLKQIFLMLFMAIIMPTMVLAEVFQYESFGVTNNAPDGQLYFRQRATQPLPEAQTVTIKNTTSATLYDLLIALDKERNFIVTGTGLINLSAGATHEITVTPTKTVEGYYDDAIFITHPSFTGSIKKNYIPIRHSVDAASYVTTLDKRIISFGTHTEGETISSQTITLTNTADLTVTDLYIEVEAGQTSNFDVTISPKHVSVDETATITVTPKSTLSTGSYNNDYLVYCKNTGIPISISSFSASITIDSDGGGETADIFIGGAYVADSKNQTSTVGSIASSAFNGTHVQSPTGRQGVINYQWFAIAKGGSFSDNGTAIDGATSATYTPTVPSEAGTYYYYVVARNELSGYDASSHTERGYTLTVSDGGGETADIFIGGAYVADSKNQTSTVGSIASSAFNGTHVQSPTGRQGVINYQWFAIAKGGSFSDNGTAIDGATSATYTPTVPSEAGTYYYYVVARNELSGYDASSHTERGYTLTVSEPTSGKPIFDTDPNSHHKSATATAGESGGIFGTNASVIGGGGFITYKWYEVSSNGAISGGELKKSGSDNYISLEAKSTAGKYYYYVVIENNNGQSATLGGFVLTVENPLAETYELSFDANGGTGTMADVSIDKGDSYTIPECTFTAPRGKEFAGWNLKINGELIKISGVIAVIEPGRATTPSTDVIFVAKWKTKTLVKTYTLTFDANGGSTVAPQTYYAGKVIALPTAPTKTGYTFNGWTIGTTALVDGTAWIYTANQTAVAQWTANKYELSINGTTKEVTYGVAIGTLPTPTAEAGKTFAGWKIGTTAITSTTVWNYTTDQTATAEFTDKTTYTLSFDVVGGSEVAPQTYYAGKVIALPTAPTKTGYTFNGWKIGTTALANGTAWAYTANQTATASWTANKYELSINGTTIDVTYGVAIGTLPTPTAEAGKTFAGWKIGTTAITSTTVWNYTTDQTATAEFTDKTTYTLSFDVVGGSEVAPQTYYAGKVIALPTAPTKTGYTFNGWKIGTTALANGTAWAYTANQTATASWTANKYELSINGTTIDVTYGVAIGTLPTPTAEAGKTFAGWKIGTTAITSTTVWNYTTDQTATASWTANKYELSINGTTIDVTYGVAIGTLPTPTAEAGKTFAGWKIGTTAITSTTVWNYTTDQTATAEFTDKTTYELSFDVAGGSEVAPQTYYAGKVIALPTAPTKTGYTFNGWKIGTTALANGIAWAYTADQTAVAQWTAIEYTITVGTETITYTVGEEVELPVLTKASDSTLNADGTTTKNSYVFKGWLNGIDTITTIPVGTTGDITLTATWQTETVVGLIDEVAQENYNSDVLVVGPMPINNKSKVFYTVEEAGVYTLELYNLAEKLMSTTKVDAQDGRNITNWTALQMLPKGVYYIAVKKDGEFISLRRIVK